VKTMPFDKEQIQADIQRLKESLRQFRAVLADRLEKWAKQIRP